MTVRNIVWVDDEPKRIEEYTQEVQNRGFAVRLFTGVDSFLAELECRRSALCDAFVLDVMMPTGSRVSAACAKEGQLTGVVLCRRVIGEVGESVPIALLTNRPDQKLQEFAERHRSVEVFSKILLYDDFADRLTSFFQGCSE